MPTTTGTATSFITFTRASTATRVNASGLIESVATNTPRLDYDPVTLAPKGLLVEVQRTNLLLRSEEFENASWGKSAVFVTANSTISPDGSADSDTVTVTAGAAYVFQSVTVASGTQYVAAIHVKKTTGTPSYYPAFHANRGGSPAFTGVIINTTTGAITTTPGAAYIAPITQGCIDCGQYWRVYISFTAQSTSAITYFYPAVSSDGATLNTGITSGSQSIYGAQLEAGSFVTSYIPTTTATVTRSADVASVATSSFPYSATEGTVIFSGNDIPTPVGAAFQFGLSDGTILNSIGLRRNSSNFIIPTVYTGGTLAWSIGITTLSSAGNFKAAIAYKLNDYAATVNSLTPITNTSITVPTMTNLGIGSVAGGTQMNGWINSITYIPRRLTNTELQARTAA